MANFWYDGGKVRIMDHAHSEAIDLTASVIRVALMKTSYVPNTGTHVHWNDVSGSTIVATNYTSGNIIFGTQITNDTVNHRAEFSGQDTTFTGIGNGTNDTFDQIVIYKSLGDPTTSPVISHHDVGSTTTNGGDITLQWDAEGILQLS